MAAEKSEPAEGSSPGPAGSGTAVDSSHRDYTTFQIAVNRQYQRKLPQGDPCWWDFNNTFENVTLDAAGLAEQIRAGHAYTAPHKHEHVKRPDEPSTAYRHALNFLHAQHIGLDFDTEDENSTFPALRRDPFIAQHAAFLHTTASHTPEKPRARAVFILDQPIMAAADYADAMAALLWKFKGYADRACKDAARLFFGAPGCDIDMLGGTLPLAVVNGLIAEFKAAMELERARSPHYTFTPSTPELAELADMLRCIPAEGDYHDDWLRVLMAVHSEYPGADGIALCEGWSPGYPGEIARKFRSFSRNGNAAGKVSIATLIWKAGLHGWKQPEGKIILRSKKGRLPASGNALPRVAEGVSWRPLPELAQLSPEAADGASPWLDSYIAFSHLWSPRAPDDLHEALGLWVLSSVAAGRVVLHLGGPRYTNLYIAPCMRTSVYAKSTTANIGADTLAAAGLLCLLAPDDATPQAFVSSLTTRVPPDWSSLPEDARERFRQKMRFAAQRAWFFEEFGQKINAMMRQGGFMTEFRGLLRKFDDCPPTYEYVTIGRGNDSIEHPYLALLANLTPADLRPFARRGAQLWNDGFWARFAFITPEEGERKRGRFPEGIRLIPSSISAPLKGWHLTLGVPEVTITERIDKDGKPTGSFDVDVNRPEPQTCELGPGVFEAFYAYGESLIDLVTASNSEDLDGNYSRMPEKAMRVAMLLASLENGGLIEMRHWARGQQVAERWRLNLHHLYEQVNEPEFDPAADEEDKIMDIVGRLGSVTAAELRRYRKGMSSASASTHLANLANAGMLAVEQTRKGTARYSLPGEKADQS